MLTPHDHESETRRVLIVDDDKDFSDSLSELLELRGYQTATADNSEAALAAVAQFKPAIAMIDVRLGPHSGVDVLARMSALRPHLICILISAHADIETAIGALREGAYDYYEKSADPADLFAILDRAFEKRALLQERDAAARQLAEQKQFLDLVIENVPATIIVKDARDFRYVLINRAGEAYYGLPREQMIGRTAYDVLPEESAQLVADLDRQIVESVDKPVQNEHIIEMAGNVRRVGMSTRLPIFGQDGKPQYLLAVIDDITERKKAEAQIVHMAYHDALTGVPNRLRFHERLGQVLGGNRRVDCTAVLCLDLDHFKTVNDTLGHHVGDELLKNVAERLRRCIRETDMVARLGGDEFAIIQGPLEQPAEAAALATRILDIIRRPYDLAGHQVVMDASIGIAVAPNDGREAEALLKNADLAMYGAKTEGRGTYRFFEPEMDARMKARRQLETDLRKALSNGELELHYQPFLNLQNDEIGGVEALLRWHHPARGLVSPVEFIPIAEETGLIGPIGEWVLQTACREAARWPDNIRVAVNLSPAQFKGKNLVQLTVNALAASGLSATRLEFEITETVLMQNSEATLSILHQLRGLGVRIAMDDFGTGYSSLSYLRSFPFDKIKIDRSFINDLSNGQDAHSIVCAIATLARNLNMTTTAEGVETQQQLEFVRKLECNEAQGYLFSAARPADEITQFLLQHAGMAANAA